MEASNVATYQELQADFPRLFKLHYATPPVYDPNDPSTKRTYRLRVSALFFPTLDLEAALRRLVLARRALDATRPHPDEYEGGDIRATDAWMGIFPASAIGAGTVTQANVEDIFAAEGFVAAFETV